MSPPRPRGGGASSACSGRLNWSVSATAIDDRAMPGASSAWTHASLRLLDAVLKSLTALPACFLLLKRRVDESESPGANTAGSSCTGPVLLRALDAAFRKRLRPRQHRSSSAPRETKLHSPIVTALVSAPIDASVQGAELGRRGDGDGAAAAAAAAAAVAVAAVVVATAAVDTDGGIGSAEEGGAEGSTTGGGANRTTSQRSHAEFAVASCSPPGAQHRQPTLLFNESDHMIKSPQAWVDAATAAQLMGLSCESPRYSACTRHILPVLNCSALGGGDGGAEGGLGGGGYEGGGGEGEGGGGGGGGGGGLGGGEGGGGEGEGGGGEGEGGGGDGKGGGGEGGGGVGSGGEGGLGGKFGGADGGAWGGA
jgi:hypothetical protein